MKLRIAVLIPVVGFLLLVVRAEFQVRSGFDWLVPIEGYDPRDLLRGHYLNYRIVRDNTVMCTDCCLCLHAGTPVTATPMDCEAAHEVCEAVLKDPNPLGGQKFYVPEKQANELQTDVREHHAAVLLSVQRNGHWLAKELYIDGKPWR